MTRLASEVKSTHSNCLPLSIVIMKGGSELIDPAHYDSLDDVLYTHVGNRHCFMATSASVYISEEIIVCLARRKRICSVKVDMVKPGVEYRKVCRCRECIALFCLFDKLRQ